ncbi:MAG: hypothetical protein ACYDAE_02585 [Steroidobacteraceae bacterium]
MKLRRLIILIVLWLTRAGGVAFILFGLGFFVPAWRDKSGGLILMGIIAIVFGVVLTSIHAPSPDRLQYRLLSGAIFTRRKRQ